MQAVEVGGFFGASEWDEVFCDPCYVAPHFYVFFSSLYILHVGVVQCTLSLRMKLLGSRFFSGCLLALAVGGAAPTLLASTATDITGLYYTGLNGSGGLGSGGSQDANWQVTYAEVAGNDYNGNSTYTGDAYVVDSSYIPGSYVANTSSAQWITAPGAKTSSSSGSTANIGGTYLPGNGTTGVNAAQYIYTLEFTIHGTGGGKLKSDISISLTIAADDQYTVYVNPKLNNDGSIKTSKSDPSASGTSAWNNTTVNYLQNYDDSNSDKNAKFKLGTNTLVIVVDNTNSKTGSSSSTGLNASGLLVYQTSAALIDGNPIPEAGAVLPIVGAIGLFGVMVWRRRRGTQDSLQQ